jgi:hypothetical protein
MVLSYGCAGRLTAKNGGFRPGQIAKETYTPPAVASLYETAAAPALAKL